MWSVGGGVGAALVTQAEAFNLLRKHPRNCRWQIPAFNNRTHEYLHLSTFSTLLLVEERVNEKWPTGRFPSIYQEEMTSDRTTSCRGSKSSRNLSQVAVYKSQPKNPKLFPNKQALTKNSKQARTGPALYIMLLNKKGAKHSHLAPSLFHSFTAVTLDYISLTLDNSHITQVFNSNAIPLAQYWILFY